MIPIEIKELIIKGRINGSTSIEEKDIIEVIKKHQDNSSNTSPLTESLRRSIVDECVQDVITKLESKINY